MSGTGSMRERSPGKWELKFDLPRGADGRRRTRTETIHGGKRQAAARLRELLASVDRGEAVDRNTATVAAWAAERIATWTVSARTREGYSTIAKLLEPIGDVQLQRLDSRAVEKWHSQLRARGLSPRTVRHGHALLARILSDAVKHQMLSRNVAQLQPPPRAQSRPPVEILNSEELAELLPRLDATWRCPVIVAAFTGIRRGEQLGLEWRDVDLDGAKLTIRQALEETRAGGIVTKEPKTSAGRRVLSLPAVVVEALREHRRQQLEFRMACGLGRLPESSPVFPGPSGGFDSPRLFSMRWARAAARFGVPEIVWHAWRHCHSSLLISRGLDVVLIAKRLGHSSPAITLSTYSHMFAKSDEAAALAIDAALAK